MALSSSSSLGVGLLFLFFFMASLSRAQLLLPLNSDEQNSVYLVLESINSDIPWRSIFPDDLCSSAPHGVICDYFSSDADPAPLTPHVTELNFGYVSDFSPNPPCSPSSALHPRIFSAFPFLRKLFFYKCFTGANVSLSLPDALNASFSASLEELVFIENPSLVGSLSGALLRQFTRLRRLVLTGTSVSGAVPDEVADLTRLEELTLSRNRFGGELALDLANLKSLKILDLSHNRLQGNLSDTIGRPSQLLKLDLSWNRFTGKIPDSLEQLQRLRFLDLSHNELSQSGLPSFLGRMPRLREVHLSGNKLGGQIPEMWANLGGILGMGLSDMGLVGKIPASMGAFLRNLSYLGLDNNKLEGTVPEEFGLLEKLNELNLENNNLSGRLPFSSEFASRMGGKLKLRGNLGLCVDERLATLAAFNGSRGGSSATLKLCAKLHLPRPVQLHQTSSSSSSSSSASAIHLMLSVILGFLFVFA